MVSGKPAFLSAASVSEPKSPSDPYFGKMLLPYLLIRACCNNRTLLPLLPFFKGKPVAAGLLATGLLLYVELLLLTAGFTGGMYGGT